MLQAKKFPYKVKQKKRKTKIKINKIQLNNKNNSQNNLFEVYTFNN